MPSSNTSCSGSYNKKKIVGSETRARYNACGMNASPGLLFPDASLQLIWPLPLVVVGILGAVIGSFLNVVIHRVPREQSIVFPNSACPACGVAIAFYDNVPVVSYLLLRGRCRSCKAGISPRYLGVEILTALLYGAVAWRIGINAALPFYLI